MSACPSASDVMKLALCEPWGSQKFSSSFQSQLPVQVSFAVLAAQSTSMSTILAHPLATLPAAAPLVRQSIVILVESPPH